VAASRYECIGRVSVHWLEPGGPCVVVAYVSVPLMVVGVFRFSGLCMLSKSVVGLVQRNLAAVRNKRRGPSVVLDDLSLLRLLDCRCRFFRLCTLFPRVLGFVQRNVVAGGSECGGSCVLVDGLSLRWMLDGRFRFSVCNVLWCVNWFFFSADSHTHS
jgi:hypothetical protein